MRNACGLCVGGLLHWRRFATKTEWSFHLCRSEATLIRNKGVLNVRNRLHNTRKNRRPEVEYGVAGPSHKRCNGRNSNRNAELAC